MNRFLLCLIFLSFAAPALGQDASQYRSVKNAASFDLDWKAFYAQADGMTAQARKTLRHYTDLPYGPVKKQQLDLYLPAAAVHDAPVVVFLHGGGFWEGDRAHHGYVATPLAAHGAIVAIPSYRLTPDARYPQQPNDVRDALTWVYQNAASYGGDPHRIYVVGWSAGAILAAEVGLDNAWTTERCLPKSLITGLVLVSAPYDLRPEKFVADYMPDAWSKEAGSPVLHVRTPPPRVLLSAGGKETAYVESARKLATTIERKGTKPELIVVPGRTHDRMGLELANPKSPLVKAMVIMIENKGKK